jgi:hypothetical protein
MMGSDERSATEGFSPSQSAIVSRKTLFCLVMKAMRVAKMPF